MAGRRYGSGCWTSSRTSVTATGSPYPLLDDERTEHGGGVHVALEVVRPRLQRRDLVGGLRHAGDGVRGARGAAQPGAPLLRVDLDVVRDTGVLVVEVDREGLVGRRGQAVRVEVDVLRRHLDGRAGRRARRALGLLRRLPLEPRVERR